MAMPSFSSSLCLRNATERELSKLRGISCLDVMAAAVLGIRCLRRGLIRIRYEAEPRLGLRLQIHAIAEPGKTDPPYTDFVESSEEYKYVERLIPPTCIPDPPKHQHPTPSGWRPPRDPPAELPYMVRRSRMHNVPVYTDITQGNRQMTVIRKIEGDIWALEKEVKEFLMQLSGKNIITQVNEISRNIRIKGYFDKELKTWLMDKGF